ncbi:hypothetical protein PPERSA_03375 [Pseudocohnilembus persalinus]|uniref:Ubiquitin-like domain-containing protein n=1 Tax=Pseudocohnilembus persalinus TaxID=266149 RepID=A0A0V0R1X8_PSEPJ|nr:hypothetical protein PPERSA_03375 [Pseudocohnilembus persalinus]|eukprot:KRX08381.1 hypothetical protein PPERSA_03375 [Pseudocohnilembus persalinus]
MVLFIKPEKGNLIELNLSLEVSIEKIKELIEKEVILKEINKENIIINLEELKEKLKIFIKTEKRIVEIEVEPNQQIRYLKIQLQKKWGVSVTQQCLRFGSKLLFDETTFADYDIRSGDILYFSLKPQQYQFQTQGGYQVMVTQLNSETEVDKAQKLKQNKPSEILITPKL